ncbi:hypothetical protein HY490_03190, partial [Candidatus Woesearchaeota archaeon]|nr:hypothetical protein [Candidatus Woesearchaeota archaeon]
SRWEAFKAKVSDSFAGVAGSSIVVGTLVTVGTVIAGLLVYWLIALLL